MWWRKRKQTIDVIINGKKIRGKTIKMENGVIEVDGVVEASEESETGTKKPMEIHIIGIANIEVSGDLVCNDINGNVRVSGDIMAGNVKGDVNAGGDVTCKDVSGSLRAGGDVQAERISGSIIAGGDVSTRR